MESINNFLVKVSGAEQADRPWYIKNIKVIAIAVAFLTIILGFFMLFNIIFLAVFGFLGGIFQILAGVLILTVEAPKLFTKVPALSVFDERIGKRPYWIRSIFYVLIMIPTIVLWASWASILPYSLIIIVAVLYAIIGLMYSPTATETTTVTPTQTTPPSIPA